jgi:thiamine pyrophosphokinase
MPVEKDDTDTLHAMRIGLERGFARFEIYGGTGGREDHTVANLQCLLFLVSHGARGALYGNGYLYTVIHNEAMDFPPEAGGDFSAFCMDGEARGVCEEGFKYSLDNAAVRSDFPIGVSNSFTGRPARISVADGTLILYYQI